MACDPKNARLKLLPWGGVAAHVFVDNGIIPPPLSGKAFCFLPLPTETQLPVHVNGYFELSSNRRDIWFGEDMAGDGRQKSEWNHLLLADVVARSYSLLLMEAAKILGPGSNFYSLWPTALPPKPWSAVVRALYHLLKDMRVLWSEVQGGCWISPRSAVLLKDEIEGAGPDRAKTAAELHEILLQEGQPVVKLPTKLHEMLVQFECAATEISPAYVRQMLKKQGSHPSLMKRSNALKLLQYCMSDLSAEDYGELVGLKLIPLADGTLGTFEAAVDDAGM
jgi:sacsin